MILYGIKNCNTVKAAVDFLTKKNVSFEFHDYKKKGVTEEKLRSWIDQVGWERLINKRGTTWKQLDTSVQNSIDGPGKAIELMLEKTSVIKRPLVEKEGKVITLGFDEDEFRKLVSR